MTTHMATADGMPSPLDLAADRPSTFETTTGLLGPDVASGLVTVVEQARAKAPFAGILAGVNLRRFVQWASDDDGVLTIEAVSNSFLEADCYLSVEEERRLDSAGFVASPDANWQQNFPAWVDAAHVASAILDALHAFDINAETVTEFKTFSLGDGSNTVGTEVKPDSLLPVGSRETDAIEVLARSLSEMGKGDAAWTAITPSQSVPTDPGLVLEISQTGPCRLIRVDGSGTHCHSVFANDRIAVKFAYHHIGRGSWTPFRGTPFDGDIIREKLATAEVDPSWFEIATSIESVSIDAGGLYLCPAAEASAAGLDDLAADGGWQVGLSERGEPVPLGWFTHWADAACLFYGMLTDRPAPWKPEVHSSDVFSAAQRTYVSYGTPWGSYLFNAEAAYEQCSLPANDWTGQPRNRTSATRFFRTTPGSVLTARQGVAPAWQDLPGGAEIFRLDGATIQDRVDDGTLAEVDLHGK